MRTASFLAISLGFVLSACAPMKPAAPPDFHVTAAFDAGKTEAQLAPGAALVRGNAFLRQSGGGVVTCAGQQVTLAPATKYSKERLGGLYGFDAVTRGGGFNNERTFTFIPDPPEYRRLMRFARCDAQGNFEFDRISDGEYFVVTEVSWKVGYRTEGGHVMKLFEVKDGRAPSVIVSGQ